MNKYIVYTKNVELQKKGDICLYPEFICEQLVKSKVAKYYIPKEA